MPTHPNEMFHVSLEMLFPVPQQPTVPTDRTLWDLGVFIHRQQFQEKYEEQSTN